VVTQWLQFPRISISIPGHLLRAVAVGSLHIINFTRGKGSLHDAWYTRLNLIGFIPHCLKILCGRFILDLDAFLFPATNWEKRNGQELVKRQIASKSTFSFKLQALVKEKHINDALPLLIRFF